MKLENFLRPAGGFWVVHTSQRAGIWGALSWLVRALHHMTTEPQGLLQLAPGRITAHGDKFGQCSCPNCQSLTVIYSNIPRRLIFNILMSPNLQLCQGSLDHKWRVPVDFARKPEVMFFRPLYGDSKSEEHFLIPNLRSLSTIRLVHSSLGFVAGIPKQSNPSLD